jgi:hypothetical protein
MNAGLGSFEGSPFRKRSTKIWYQIASLAHPGGSSNGAVNGHDWPSTSQVTQHVNRITDFLHTTDIVSLVNIHFACALAKRFCFDPHVFEHCDEQVAQRRTFFVGDVPAMFGPATCEGVGFVYNHEASSKCGKRHFERQVHISALDQAVTDKNTPKRERTERGVFTFHIT